MLARTLQRFEGDVTKVAGIHPGFGALGGGEVEKGDVLPFVPRSDVSLKGPETS